LSQEIETGHYCRLPIADFGLCAGLLIEISVFTTIDRFKYPQLKAPISNWQSEIGNNDNSLSTMPR
jgi:hypothetical protein